MNYVREEIIFDLADKTAWKFWGHQFCLVRVESENQNNFSKKLCRKHFTDYAVQSYLLVSSLTAVKEWRSYTTCLHGFLNEVFEHKHAISVGIIFLLFILQDLRNNEKIPHRMHLSLVA